MSGVIGSGRSWGATISDHWVFLLLFTITGPLTIFYAFVSFVYYVRNRGTPTGIDAFRIGMFWFVYGSVMVALLV